MLWGKTQIQKKYKYKYKYRYRYRRSGRKWGYDALRTLFPDDKRWIPGPKCSPVSQGKEKATIEGWIIVGWCVFHWPMGCSLILPGHCFSPNVQCIHSAQKDFLESDKSDTAGHLPNAVVFSLKWRNVLSQICTQLQWLESRSRSRSPVPGPQWLLQNWSEYHLKRKTNHNSFIRRTEKNVFHLNG